MVRCIVTTGMVAVALFHAPNAEAGGRYICVHAQYGHLPHTQRQRVMLPPQAPYRDRCYRPAPRVMRTVYGPPVVLGFVPRHNPNVPIYNKPPPRFSHD